MLLRPWADREAIRLARLEGMDAFPKELLRFELDTRIGARPRFGQRSPRDLP